MKISNCEMRLENFLNREIASQDKASITYKIENQKILVPNKGIKKYTFCVIIIEYNGIKHYSHFAYDKEDVLYFKEYNITPEIVISKMIEVILNSTNISIDIVSTDNLNEFIKEFEKYTKKLLK